MNKLPGIIALLLSSFLLALPASAAFKCEQDGRISYSDQPCPAGSSKALPVADSPGADETRRARDRAKKQADELAHIEQTAQRERIAAQKAGQRQASADAAKKRSCALLALQRQWREEDAVHAPARTADKAKRQARRAAEKYGLQCGAT